MVSTKSVMFLRVFMLLVLFWASHAVSGTDSELSTESVNTYLSTIEADVEDKSFLLQRLDLYLMQLPSFTTWAEGCISSSNDHLADTDKHLEKLGQPVDGESKDVSLTRQNLLTNKTMLETTLASCKAILVRSDVAINKISIFRMKNLERQSLERGRNILTVINETVTESHQWMSALVGVLASNKATHALTGSRILMLFSILTIALVTGLIIRKTLQRWSNNVLKRWKKANFDKSDTGMRVLDGLAMTTRRYIVPLLVSSSIGLFMYIETFDQVPKPLLTIIMDGLPLLILAFALTYFVYISALRKPGLRVDMGSVVAHSLRKSFNILALVWFLGYMLFQTILANSLSESAFFLARAILGTVLVLNVIWIIWLTKGIKGQILNAPVRIIVSLILIGTLVAELTGYRNLSGFVLRGIVGTLITYSLLQIVSHLVSTFLDEFNAGKSSWQQRIRMQIGVSNNESITGFIWVRFITSISIWLLFIASLLVIWRVPDTDVGALSLYITHGFTIGSIEFVPIRIFEAIVVLIVLLTINGGVQRRLKGKWLAMTGIERGARESIATVGNYIGIALAIIISLAAAGLDFSKLAIIAGALSVGIGFGLQNIVNNFVSGLILLFERPIKTGDWIVANGVEGHVKKISIRSTEIESFDHADIIVPNSELISGNLINWEHKNRNGRICVPISVAYGSNTEQVKELLIGIARNHQEVVIGDPSMHDPKVLFLAFGESSLDLELRFFIREIHKRVDILSDMNFAVDKVFRENAIEIPYPQRDVHIRDIITKGTDINEITVDTKT